MNKNHFADESLITGSGRTVHISGRSQEAGSEWLEKRRPTSKHVREQFNRATKRFREDQLALLAALALEREHPRSSTDVDVLVRNYEKQSESLLHRAATLRRMGDLLWKYIDLLEAGERGDGILLALEELASEVIT